MRTNHDNIDVWSKGVVFGCSGEDIVAQSRISNFGYHDGTSNSCYIEKRRDLNAVCKAP